MLTLILDTLYYICCFGHKPKQTTPFELVINNLDDLAHHELEYLEKQMFKKKKTCCF